MRSLSHRTPPTSMAAVHRLLGPSWCQALVPWAVCRGTALSSAIGMLREEDHPPRGSLCEWRRLRAAVNIGPRCPRDRSPVLRQPQPKRRSHVAQGPGLLAASMDCPAPHLHTGRSKKIGSVDSAPCPPQAAQGKIEHVPLFALLSSTGSSPVPQGSRLPGLRPPKCLGRQLLIHTFFFFLFGQGRVSELTPC